MKIKLIGFLYLIFSLLIFSCFAYAQQAEVIYVSGNVLVSNDGAVWSPAEEGMTLTDGDTIKTSKLSQAEIAFDSEMDNIVNLDQESELRIQDILDKRMDLKEGKVFALLNNLEGGSSFEIRTPTAVCGVVGSGMFVKTGNNQTIAGCHEDKAYAKGINQNGSFVGSKNIPAGFKSIIEQFKSPGDLMKLTNLEKGQWNKFMNALKKHKQSKKSGKSSSSKNFNNLQNLQDKLQNKMSKTREDRFEEGAQGRRKTTPTTTTSSGGYDELRVGE